MDNVAPTTEQDPLRLKIADWVDDYAEYLLGSEYSGKIDREECLDGLLELIQLDRIDTEIEAFKKYKRQCGMLRVEPTTWGLNRHIEELESQKNQLTEPYDAADPLISPELREKQRALDEAIQNQLTKGAQG